MSVDDEKIREILSKIGINEDYICENNVGDHGVYDSKNFKLDEVKFVEDIDIDKEKFYDIYSKYIVDVINVIKRNPYMRVYVTADSDNISKVFDNQNVQAKFKNFLKGGDNLDGSNKIVLKTFLDLLRCYSVDDLINNNDTIKKELIKRMENVESLPSYTSDIVNVGIQQGGIDEKIPDAIAEAASALEGMLK